MDREADRDAFVKACAYLNYHPWAKWLAHVAAAATGLCYVGLLTVLWLFADLMVYHGQIPNYRALSLGDQDRFLREWSSLPEDDRVKRLEAVGFSEEQSKKLAHLPVLPEKTAGLTESEKRVLRLNEPPEKTADLSENEKHLIRVEALRSLPRERLEDLWRAQLGHILQEAVQDDSRVNLEDYRNYDEDNNGLLSPVVRCGLMGPSRPRCWPGWHAAPSGAGTVPMSLPSSHRSLMACCCWACCWPCSGPGPPT